MDPNAEDEGIVPSSREAKSKMALSLEHLLTHTPRLLVFCSVCDRGEARKSYSRRVPCSERDAVEREKQEELRFGQKVTADAFFDALGSDVQRPSGAELICDLGTKWMEVHPGAKRTTHQVVKATKHFKELYIKGSLFTFK